MSAVFFAAPINYAYLGTHASETYKQFPYQRLDSYTSGSRVCDSIPAQSISDFTPLCRPWYFDARYETDTVYNRVLDDAANVGQKFLSLSKALRQGGDAGELVGVMAVDVSLKDLGDKIGACPESSANDCRKKVSPEPPSANLYDRGYAMMWDADGYAIIHKNYAKDENQDRGALKVAELDSGTDGGKFYDGFVENVVQASASSGR